MEWSEEKFLTKAVDKISSAIALRYVDLSTKMDNAKKVLDNIYSLYSKLCNVDFFTQETQQTIDLLKGDHMTIGSTLKTSPGTSQTHF